MALLKKLAAALGDVKSRTGHGHTFTLASHIAKAAYTRNGQSCYLCHARKKLIITTPEEEVRQAFINFLLKEVGVPADCIKAEVPMSEFRKGASGRADIVIYSADEDRYSKPVAIVECKEPKQPLIDHHFSQVRRYEDIVGAGLVIVTNGHEVVTHLTLNGHIQELEKVPTYSQMLNPTKHRLKLSSVLPIYVRESHKKINRKLIKKNYVDYGFIGEDTQPALYSFLVNLIGFFEDDQALAPRFTARDIRSIKDQGVRYTSFGNAAGGSWPGQYRYFIVNHNNEDHIVSMNVTAKGKFVDDPMFGNTRGYTMLCVAVDDFEKSHLSLELSLDRFTEVIDETYTIWHNGTLTNGKKGAVKRQEVVDFVVEHAPDLVDKENRIVLGNLDNAEWITWHQPNTKQFVKNLIRYALLRDAFRRMKNSKG
jgi:hypothetical protein